MATTKKAKGTPEVRPGPTPDANSAVTRRVAAKRAELAISGLDAAARANLTSIAARFGTSSPRRHQQPADLIDLRRALAVAESFAVAGVGAAGEFSEWLSLELYRFDADGG